MKKSDIIEISKANIIKNKQNIYYISVILLAIMLISISLIISKNINVFIEKSQNNNVGFRTLNVAPNYNEKDYGYELLKHTDNIVEIYSSKYSGITVDSSFKNEILNGKIGLIYGSKNTIPKIELGKSYEDMSTGYAICPMQFFPDDGINDLKIDSSQILKQNETLNKVFEVYYNSYELTGNRMVIKNSFTKKFKIIGLYDNRKVLNMNNECYISPTDLKDIIDSNYLDQDEQSIYSQYAIVDELKNVNIVTKYLKNKGFDEITSQVSLDKNFFNSIFLFSKTINIILIIIVTIITFFYNRKKMLNERKNIGVYKALGYSSFNIVSIYLTEMTIINILSLLLSYIVYIMLFNCLKNYYFKSLTYIGVDINSYNSFFLISFLLIFTISVLVLLIDLWKILKVNVTDLIGSDEL